MEDRLDLERRIATLEAENLAAKPLHDKLITSIDELREGQVRIATRIEMLITNGHSRTKVRDATIAGGGAAVIAAIAGVLRYFGV